MADIEISNCIINIQYNSLKTFLSPNNVVYVITIRAGTNKDVTSLPTLFIELPFSWSVRLNLMERSWPIGKENLVNKSISVITSITDMTTGHQKLSLADFFLVIKFKKEIRLVKLKLISKKKRFIIKHLYK